MIWYGMQGMKTEVSLAIPWLIRYTYDRKNFGVTG